jgi:propanol-preferring alcohol dehydrogenase
MRAVKLVSPGTISLEHVDVPEPGPGEILVRIAGAGLCHSDLHVLHLGDDWPFFGGTVGHEGSGWVEAVGVGADGFSVGEAVIVMVVWGCGRCRPCAQGRENACAVNGTRTGLPTTPGLGPDGSMAEYMLVKPQHLDKLGDLDPVSSAPLADAAVTPMHAINTARRLLTPGSTAVVIGLGGLGHLGVQLLRETTAARIITVVRSEQKAEVSRELGADAAVRNDGGNDAAAAILEHTDGYGADVVFDFVGMDATVELATRTVAPEGMIQFIGLDGGKFTFVSDTSGEALPWGVTVQRPYGGTRKDLSQVVALAQAGKLTMETRRYPLDEFRAAFDDLEAGRIAGRAVLVT